MKRAKIMLVFVLILSILCIQSPCFAQTIIRKLGRGVANVFTSVFEIPKSIQEKLFSDGPAAAATYGILDGIYKFVVRTAAGAFEIVTFPIPFPADYGPIVEPEFLFGPDEPYEFND